jgi:hypothetical protein
MANELDKTIEELEAEVLSELEEANGADAPMKSAGKPDKMDKAEGEVQDTGKAVVSPTQGDAPAKKIAAKAKEVSGDAAQKGEGKPDSMDKPNDAEKKAAKPLAAGFEAEGDEVISEMDKMEMDKEPKTKMEYMTAMKDMMMGMDKMKKEKLHATYNAIKSAMHPEGAHEETEEEKAKSEAVENRLKSIDVSEHLEALISGEGDLSEDFKRKAATVFEAAVKSKVRSEVERMEDEYKSELEENINTTKEELTEKVDSYMNYVVEEWMKENELAIERGLKGEIAEDFISGL